jgi:hypothetical protein
MIKGTIHQEYITIVNIYTLDIRVPNFIKQKLLHIEEQIDPNILIVGNFNTPLTPIDKSSRQKNQQRNLRIKHYRSDGLNIYRIFHPTSTEYTILLSSL